MEKKHKLKQWRQTKSKVTDKIRDDFLKFEPRFPALLGRMRVIHQSRVAIAGRRPLQNN